MEFYPEHCNLCRFHPKIPQNLPYLCEGEKIVGFWDIDLIKEKTWKDFGEKKDGENRGDKVKINS